jgi:vitamin K-dependent gamma-carboxylase
MKANKKNQVASTPEQKIQLSGATIQELFCYKSWKTLFLRTDISSLVFYRILFGLLMLYEVSRYLSSEWIYKYWIQPKFHFTYWPFDFLQPLPGDGMYVLFYVMALLSVFIIIGFFYRLSMLLFWLCFSYMFLLEQTRYMNHFYLLMLISFVMIFIPVHTSASVDSKLFKDIKSETAPVWSLWLMRFMVGVPYFFGGVAKLNADWLQGQPLKIWLGRETDFPIIGSLFQYDWMIYFMAYSGLLLDLFIVPALLFKKTRLWGFILIVTFHLMNSQLFNIGVFPWFMIAATSLYFNPGWFRNVVNFVTGNSWKLKTSLKDTVDIHTKFSLQEKVVVGLLLFWVTLQSVLPLRHFFIPGSAHWTEEGHRYAWHMKLRTKSSKGYYKVVDKKTGQTEIVDPRDYLTKRQYIKVGDRPYLVWQFCQMLKKEYKEKKNIDVAVYANIQSTLNGRKYQQLIDSTVDLTSVPRPIFPASWIVPLTTPLSDQLEKNQNEDDGGE